MPNKLLFRPGGTLVFEDPGKLVFNPFATTVPPTTTTTTGGPSSCPGANPEIYLTVSDPTYVGGDIIWCGQTWTQAQVQAGTKKGPVCPESQYSKGRGNGTYLGTLYYWATNIWRNSNNGGLTIRRNYHVFQFYSFWYRAPVHFFTNLETVKLRGVTDRRNNRRYGDSNRPVQWNTVTFSKGDIGLICPLGATYNLQYPPMPTAYPNVPYYNTYAITADFFGSTVIAGVTYTWEQGNGW